MIKTAPVEVSNDLNFRSLQSLGDSKILDKFGTKNIAKNVRIRYNIGFDIRDLKMNLELLNQIHQIHQDLADGKEVELLRLTEKRKVNLDLLKDIHELYYNGHLHLPKYCHVFGYKDHESITKNFKRYKLKLLNGKEIHNLYGNEISKKRTESNIERYGCRSPSQSSNIKEKIKQTNLERYGSPCVLGSPEIQEKIKQTNLERYGHENPFGSPEIQEKIKQTNLERYGHENPFGSPEIQDKIKQTNTGKYGSVSPFGSKEIRDKVIQTNLEKYGVECSLQSPEIQDKIKQTNLERYGHENPSQYPDIRKKIEQTNLERYGSVSPFGSPEIREKVKKTNLERYGVECSLQSPDIRKKIEQTNLERYGHENPLCSEVIQEKIRKTNLERYGSVSPFGSPEIREKVKKTNLERYGVECSLQSPEVMAKSMKTNLERYGHEIPSQSPEVMDKIKQTNLERYGVECSLQSPEVREKIKMTNLKMYGYPYATQSPEVREKISLQLKSEESRAKRVKSNLETYGYPYASQSPEIQDKMKQTNLETYGYPYASQSPEIREKIKDARKSKDSRYAKLLDLVENDPDKASGFVIGNYPYNHAAILRRYGLYQENLSTPEAAIREILEKHKIEYQFKFRPKFMEGKELDFFIPNKNLAIEVNGLYWHSYPKKDKYYHQDKHLRCRSEGIQLLSFSEDQILDRLEIIESMILHKLGLTPYRVYAKNCTIRELRSQEAKEFFESNHLHGWAVGQICYALEYEGKIVHAMSFGNNRFKRSDHPELIRSASLRFHSVAGGFQRLLKYYKKTYKIDLVESYVDFNISNGQSYELASKDLKDLPERDNLTEPDLWFVYRGKRYRRQMFMKHNLHKIFEDFPRRSDDNYDQVTVREFLRDRGVLEYYGAGNLKYLI